MTKLPSPSRLIAAACLAGALVGCATAPLPPQNLPVTPAAFKEADTRPGANATAMPRTDGAWWKTFSDPVLDNLVERALTGSTSVQIAAARLSQARASARAAGANRMPQAGLNAGANRQGGPLINAAGADGNLFNASVSLSYELDLVGRLSKAADAASLDAQSRESLLQSARLLVQADLTQNYLALRAIDSERTLVRSTARALRDTQALVERRHAAGLVPELEVARARAEAAATDAEAFALDRRRAELEHALAFLIGEAPASLDLAAQEWKGALPVIPAGIPSTVLSRRPDVTAAKRSMTAAQTRVGIAQTAWFPTLSLTASGGYASSELGDLFKLASRAWGIGALLALPLFDGGRREAAIQGATADLELALATYREQILVAFKDVEDQLSALRTLADQAEALEAAVAAAARATEVSESRYKRGLASQLDSLDARRSELRNRRAALAVQSQRYQATVGLVRALGGGWGDAPALMGEAPAMPGIRTAGN